MLMASSSNRQRLSWSSSTTRGGRCDLTLGAILVAHQSRSEILDRYAALQRRFEAALAGRDPIVFERARGGLPRYQVRVGAGFRGRLQMIFVKKFIPPGATASFFVIQAVKGVFDSCPLL